MQRGTSLIYTSEIKMLLNLPFILVLTINTSASDCFRGFSEKNAYNCYAINRTIFLYLKF